MSTETNCSFKVTNWNEESYKKFENGGKLTRAKVTQTYQGAINGESTLEYLMFYSDNGTVSFVGMELVNATVDGKKGIFTIQHVGFFEDGKAHSKWSIIKDSGTEELTTISGTGSYVAGHNEDAKVIFSYEF